MDIITYRNRFKSAIADTDKELADVMRELSNDIKSQKPIYNDVIVLRNRITSHNKEKMLRTQSKESLATAEAQLTEDCLALIDRLTASDLLFDDTEFNPETFVQFKKTDEIKNSVFLSTPIASLSNEAEYQELKAVAEDMLNQLYNKKEEFNHFYYAGSTISSFADFHTPEASIKKDFQAIHMHEYFILVLPYKILSSIWVEVGYAMALNKKCIFFVNDRAHLPFLLKEADKVFKNVKTVVFKQLPDIPHLLLEPGLFEFK